MCGILADSQLPQRALCACEYILLHVTPKAGLECHSVCIKADIILSRGYAPAALVAGVVRLKGTDAAPGNREDVSVMFEFK